MIHKTKKKEGKKHSEMRISTVPARFKADFGLFRSLANIDWYGQYDPILAESARFDANRSRIGANQVESAQIPKKKTQTRHRREGNSIGRRIGPRRTLVRHPPNRVYTFQSMIQIKFYKFKNVQITNHLKF